MFFKSIYYCVSCLDFAYRSCSSSGDWLDRDGQPTNTNSSFTNFTNCLPRYVCISKHRRDYWLEFGQGRFQTFEQSGANWRAKVYKRIGVRKEG